MVTGRLLLLGAFVLVGQCCNLPEFLTRRPYWESHIRMERQRTGLYIKFNENQMKIADYRTPELAQTHRECFSVVGDNKIIFSQNGADGVPKYMCIHFVKRSNFIVQIRESSLFSSVSDNLCDDVNLTDYAWPLVWVDPEEEYESCPLPGGYDFQIFDNEDGEDLCEDYWLKPRMESECLSGEGIQLDFRHYDCLGKLSMDLRQKLVCLGAWDEAGYTFSILTDRDQLWPRIWLMRLPVNRGHVFRAHLLTDIVVSHGAEIDKNIRTYILAMTKSSYTSLCENEARNCASCEKKNEFYCQKSCHKCDYLREASSIPLASASQGQWTDYNHLGQYDVIVSGSELLVEGTLPFEAFDLGAEEWFEGLGRHTLTTISLNGCKPRYTCVEFQYRSESVLQYRLSQSLVWPHTTDLRPEDVCGDQQFKDDKPPMLNYLRSEHPKLLVRKLEGNNRRTSIPTIIRGLFVVSFKFPDGTACDGLLHSCNAIDQISLAFGSCASAKAAAVTYRCLSIFRHEEDDDIYMVMENDQDADDVQCWMIHKNPWSDTQRLYMTHATECFGDLPNRVQFENYTNYINTMDFVSPTAETGFIAPCPPGGVPTATPTPIPAESRSTRLPPTPRDVPTVPSPSTWAPTTPKSKPSDPQPPPSPHPVPSTAKPSPTPTPSLSKPSTAQSPDLHPATATGIDPSTKTSKPESTQDPATSPEAISRAHPEQHSTATVERASQSPSSTPETTASQRSSSEDHPVDPVPELGTEKQKPKKSTIPVSGTNIGKPANFVNDGTLTQNGRSIVSFKSCASVKCLSVWLSIFLAFLSFISFHSGSCI